jgi:hypothetical protein
MGDFQWEFHGKTKHFIQKYMMESCSMGKMDGNLGVED